MVQDVYPRANFTLVVGKIESGKLCVGEEIVFWPEGKKVRILSLESWGSFSPKTSAKVGESVALRLEDTSGVQRGQVVSHASSAPAVGQQLKAKVFWYDTQVLSLHTPIVIKLGTQSVEGSMICVEKGVDAVSLHSSKEHSPSSMAPYEVAEVTFQVSDLLVGDAYESIEPTGRFVIVRDKKICGGGIILALSKES